ncbi:hyalin-like [Antedon mediterranea]|uniref:hyalin-like n=1 Tax=Antedon mediterranea TaxID=105859 RepID=UPI003AF73260
MPCDQCSLRLHFIDFSFESSYDFVYINSNGVQLGYHDGYSNPPDYVIPAGDTLVVRITTDGSVVKPGFQAVITATGGGDVTCNGQTTHVSTTRDIRVSSIGYPTSYYNSMDVSCTFMPCDQCSLRLHFIDFSFESSYDFVYINSNGVQLGYHDGNNNPPDYVIPAGDTLVVRITTDGSVVRPGFQAIIMATGGDNENPFINCNISITSGNLIETSGGILYISTDTGRPTATVSWTSPVVTDNSDDVVEVYSNPFISGDIFPMNENANVVEFTAVDQSGNSNTCTVLIRVVDTEDPLINCNISIVSENLIETSGGIFYISTDTGKQNATVLWTFPIANDNSGEGVIVHLRPYTPGDILPMSERPIVIESTATDSSNNTDNCTILIRVLDMEDPVIHCDISLMSGNLIERTSDIFYISTDIGKRNATVFWTSSLVTDNSGDIVTVNSHPYTSGDILPMSERPIVIEFTATDSSNNSDSCTIFIRVLGN